MNQPVLLVEDRDDDVFFMRRAWKAQGVRPPLQVARDGREAVAYLVGSEPFSDREKFPFPCLVLLDLKLPYMMGTEVLRWIRSQPHLRMLPVIMLTSSEIQRDIDEAYRLGANAFLVKPSNVAQIEGLVAVIRNFWLGANRFPSVLIEAPPVVVRAQTVFQ